MHLNRWPNRSSASRVAAIVSVVLFGVAAIQLSVEAQAPPFLLPLPQCYAPPSPDTDTWPVAAHDSLGSTAGVAVTFSAASLLANDTGAGVVFSAVDQVTSPGDYAGVASGSG